MTYTVQAFDVEADRWRIYLVDSDSAELAVLEVSTRPNTHFDMEMGVRVISATPSDRPRWPVEGL